MQQTHSELPSLRATIRLGGKDSNTPTPWFDVKFYPYTPPGADPVFAVTGGCNTVICRCVLQKENSIEIIRWFKDDDEDVALNSIEWSRAANGDPLVCVTGVNPLIKVLNVKTGGLVTTLAGHGDSVNDLATSPADPNIIASASKDKAIRIWSLDPDHRKQPTAAICFGEGHKENVLALGFHRKGQYLLSGGMDTTLNLWMIPKFQKEDLGTDNPLLIHYPYFSSTELHVDYVDCVKFHNDLILSRASKENKILLWRIDHFDSNKPPPTSAPMPPHQVKFIDKFDKSNRSNTLEHVAYSHATSTRSAWGGRFQRLLQFDEPFSEFFYIRFNLFSELGKHPVLAAGNDRSRVFFWDLQRLEEASATGEDSKQPEKKTKKDTVLSRVREGSTYSNASSGAVSISSAPTSTTISAESTSTKSAVKSKQVKEREKEKEKEKGDRTTGIGDPFRSIQAHKTVMVPKISFMVRQVSWSRAGDWCVACGDYGMICLFSRWETGIPDPEG
ncbi:WD40 repeat-like protein [Lindgomyces ingoldianus]|uniref:WD40 repeat-like protein n=1 Tax=Lindgomyces ingoldianus TaxID=673940 RepID=A0ACB6R8N8_9PLEO|nr:WD40 repeat-like protein [Lindgomyces ingoldianus]KAF2475684.1 WD40 repeat-like protein [Lindgomyces ingoldianus]